MNYNYENLDPERFQLFCQSLLNSEFPKTQSFPIGQPDGGRDAVSYIIRNPFNDEFNVFQVKFVRKDEKDIVKWLEKTVKKEQKKIEKLKKRGAKEYFLITNLSGTGHLDTGTIDRVNEILKKHIPIPSYCWWRDDLNSRLDINWDLKWIYPELFSSVDLFRIIVESRLKSEDRERRFNAIKLYVADQFDTDSKVKFKQVELQNQLFDLFIDVPISPKISNSIDYRRNRQFYLLSHSSPDIEYLKEQGYKITNKHELGIEDEEVFVGASTFFLNDFINHESLPIVLEGGPGQGKSTITQYVCQVHRIRLLNKEDEKAKVPKYHLNSSVRLPVKIDLRDFASWINNRDPFRISSDDEKLVLKSKSLDSFIAAHIEYYSGGVKFDVNDLHEILKISKLLLVLDGFDEVADVNLREEIVNIITKGVKRIKTFCSDIQVIITSRPAAFLNSPSFPKEDYEYYSLESVNSALVDIYSDKWIRSKQLSPKEGAETKKILQEKLTQPHIKNLAKNPMQLAILISLIHTKGYSLPDKRTAFYDSYIEVFFNRESEKDATVRKYRELIIELHQYVAWIIHRDAELGSNGRIRQDELIKLLEAYLEHEEHDISIAKRLFNKMAERVVALVSRIEGTFEFEVQPLREYFCAKYLYSTAPYSPTGKEKRGTKPDRFDAMAKNFYWLNVLRFYCGCFDKGELPTIIDRLVELTEDSDYRYISHPRELAAILLSDWVFAQYPRLMKNVVKILLDGLGLRTLLSTESGYSFNSTEISLPINSGRNEIVAECFDLLSSFPPKDYALELISIILSNDNGKILETWELEIKDKKDESLINWLNYGLYLRLLYKIDNNRILGFFEDKKNLVKKVAVLIQAGKSEFIESIPEITEKISESILDGLTENIHVLRTSSFISMFWRVLESDLYFSIIQSSDSLPSARLINRRHYLDEPFSVELDLPKTTFTTSHASKKYYSLFITIHQELIKPSRNWNSSIEPWETIIEFGRSLFGERIAFYNIATIGACVKVEVKEITEKDSLFDQKLSLIKRARYARLRSKNVKWWKLQAENIETDSDRYLFLSMLITWASTTTISKLKCQIDDVIENMSNEYFETLYQNLKELVQINSQNTHYKNYKDIGCGDSSIRSKLLKLLAVKLQGRNLIDFRNTYLTSYLGNDIDIYEMLQEIAFENIVNGKDIETNLKIIKDCYIKGALNENNVFEYSFVRRQFVDYKLENKHAKIILKEPESFPRVLVRIAEISLKNSISKSVRSVKEISVEEKWFNEL